MQKFICALDQAELALRMIEAGHEIKRPPHRRDPAEVLAALEPGMVEFWKRASMGAMEYFSEQVALAQINPENRLQ